MKNQLSVNRVETAINEWRSREERFSKLFSFSLSSNRPLLKEKLGYYNRIAAKYKSTQSVDERFALRILRQEHNRIEKQLYPNLLIRLLHKLLIAPFKGQIGLREDNRKSEENSQGLRLQLQRAGFTGLFEKINEQIKYGQKQFLVPVSYYLNDKEMLDHQLSFERNQSELYQFEGYKTTLYNEVKPDEKRQQYFSMHNGYMVNTTEAYNLLSGRCIQSSGTWMQLDFNDKAYTGIFVLSTFIQIMVMILKKPFSCFL